MEVQKNERGRISWGERRSMRGIRINWSAIPFKNFVVTPVRHSVDWSVRYPCEIFLTTNCMTDKLVTAPTQQHR